METSIYGLWAITAGVSGFWLAKVLQIVKEPYLVSVGALDGVEAMLTNHRTRSFTSVKLRHIAVDNGIFGILKSPRPLACTVFLTHITVQVIADQVQIYLLRSSQFKSLDTLQLDFPPYSQLTCQLHRHSFGCCPHSKTQSTYLSL